MPASSDKAVKSVPLLDLKAQWAQVEHAVRDGIERVLASQVFINGPEVEACEREILSYCRMDGAAVGVSSGTDALIVALMALGVGSDDEVLTTPYTFFATAGAIHRVGAWPVFADIDPVTYNIDPMRLKDALSERTKAIIPVHLYGQCADMEAILAVAGEVPVVEDAAQAIGAEDRGRCAGSLGRAGCFSFFPSKNLGTLGDGGMVVTRDAALGERMRCLRQHGETSRYHHAVVGGNFRFDAIHAAAIRAKLPYLDEWTEARRRNAARYDALFAEAGLVGEHVLALPAVSQSRHIFNQYVIRASRRDKLLAFLRDDARVGCAIYYPVPLHLQECFAYLGYGPGDFPESERAARETIALPVFPELSEAQQHYVVASIARFYGVS